MSELVPDSDGKGFTVLGGDTPEILRTAIRAVGKHLTVVEMVYHHANDGSDPVDVNSRFCVELTSDQEPYDRKLKVGEEWIPLRDKHNWIEEGTPVSMLSIENVPPKYNELPTDEQKELDKQKIIELKMEGTEIPFIEIPPEQSARFKPIDFEKLMIRCRKGETKFNISVFPH